MARAILIFALQLQRNSAPSEQGGNAPALQLANALVTTAALAAAGLLAAHAPGLALGIRSGITGSFMALAGVLAATTALGARRVFAVRVARICSVAPDTTTVLSVRWHNRPHWHPTGASRAGRGC